MLALLSKLSVADCLTHLDTEGNAERRVVSLVPNNSELRTFNSELGEAYNSELGKAGDSELGAAGDSELPTMPQDMASNPYPPPNGSIANNAVQV